MSSAKLNTRDVNVPVVTADASVYSILNTVYFVAGVIAVLIIVIAGLLYVSSAGNPDRVKKAKNAIIGAVAGLVFIVMAFAITEFVIKGVR